MEEAKIRLSELNFLNSWKNGMRHAKILWGKATHTFNRLSNKQCTFITKSLTSNVFVCLDFLMLLVPLWPHVSFGLPTFQPATASVPLKAA